MQSLGISSLRRFARANQVERAALLQGIDRQVRQDLRKQYWRLLKRRGTPLVVVQRRERYLLRVADDAITNNIFLYGECDFDLVKKVHRLLDRPTGSRMLVDVGANIGSICIPAVRRGYAEQAIAIEPEPMNHSLLTVNILLNSLAGRITPVHSAVGDGTVSELSLALSTENYGDHQVLGPDPQDLARATIQVPAATLDDVCPELDCERDLVWMDIQGYEAYALGGARQIVQKKVPLMMELWPAGLLRQGSGIESLLSLLEPYSSWYDMAADSPDARPLADLPALFDSLHAAKDNRYYTDVLLV